MKHSRPLLLMFLMFFIAAASHGAVDWVVLESTSGSRDPKPLGNLEWACRPCSPASTFKVVLAWAGIEEGKCQPESRRRVADKHVPGAPCDITLRQAMFYSSNDYFIGLARDLGRETLKRYVKTSGLFGKDIPDSWLGNTWRPVIKGGSLQTTALANHSLMRRIALGQLASNPSLGAQLIDAMRWPSPDPKTEVFGKTGVWGGAVWFNGFARTKGKVKIVTVLTSGSIEKRPEVIERFYRAHDLQWSDALAEAMR